MQSFVMTVLLLSLSMLVYYGLAFGGKTLIVGSVEGDLARSSDVHRGASVQLVEKEIVPIVQQQGAVDRGGLAPVQSITQQQNKQLCDPTNTKVPLVTGIMITGKDAAHEELARRAIWSFFNQTHANKALVVVNDGGYDVTSHPCLTQIRPSPDRPRLLLGELRNLGLDQVPPNTVWIQWDDDGELININILCKICRTPHSAHRQPSIHARLTYHTTFLLKIY
eukprot:m.204834 g.204834  ORF g.204834 m.204834 type:complete len:223 (+) comp15011_c0_seq11:183-851(+)